MFICYFENLSNISRLGKQLLKTLRTEPVYYFYDSNCRLFEGPAWTWHRSEGLNWSDIISKADKFLVPIHDQVLSESLEICHCMLIIFGAKLSSTIARELNYKSRCYSSGSLIDDTFKIPPNCELVILSQNDLEMFIGKEILYGLGRTFTRTDKPTLDLIGTDFMQQICSWLML
eukprot:jgi/Galph1/1752/GphlegSOOS_G466.1